MEATARPRQLRALIVEDDLDDAALLVLELERAGLAAITSRVDSLAQLASALASDGWEIVISDFHLRDFTALDALALVKDTGRDIPFIIVSGTLGEEVAVEAMKRGANDFFLKDRVHRLALAVEREVREAENRRERREAVARVAENERRFRAIFNQSIAGIAQIDLDGRFTVINEQYARIAGRSAHELHGRAIREIVVPAQRAAFDRELSIALEQVRGVAFETTYERPDGSSVWVDHSLSVVVDEHGRASFAVAIVQDITRKKHVEEELRQSIAIRDDFLAMASHELKTPVTSLELVLSSSLRVLGDGAGALDKLQQRLQVAAKQVDRLTTLIRNLLDVTQITSGRLALSPSKVDLRGVVQQVVDRMQDIVVRSGSSVELIAEHPVVGDFDAHAVETVVTNLLANAAKYGMGKPIDVRVEAAGARARIAVTDRGLGIDAIDQQRIFERFERAVPSNHYGGFGIGLWIVRNVVDAHGGSIAVTSAQGKGSSFVVELPLEMAP